MSLMSTKLLLVKGEIARVEQFLLPTRISNFLQIFYTCRVRARCNGWLSTIRLERVSQTYNIDYHRYKKKKITIKTKQLFVNEN